MDKPGAQLHIPESFLEHRQLFAEPWIERWTTPTVFISPLVSPLRAVGVELSDFSFNKDAANVGDLYLDVAIRRLNAAVRIGLDTVRFTVANPSWEAAPRLVAVFDQVSGEIRNVVGASPKSQETTLAFHLSPGSLDFGKITTALVSANLVGNCLFCGVSLHKADGTLLIDKSLRYEGAAFVRLQRTFAGDALFADIAARLHEDEVAALRLLGISEIP